MNLREQLMTVYRGGRADRTPVTIYNWVTAPPDAVQRLSAQGLTWLGSKLLFRVNYTGMTAETTETGEGAARRRRTVFRTPVGTITEVIAFDPTLGSPWIQEHMVKTIDDYRVMRYIVEHTDYEPDFATWRAADKALGQGGIVLGEIDPSPLVWTLVKVMGTEAWCEGVIEYADAFEELHEVIFQKYRRQIEIAAESPAEVVWLPDNITGSVVSPRVFEKYAAPTYAFACPALRQAGKLSFAHYDGANKNLSSNIARTGIDIIEAFTPPPMGDMTVSEGRAAWPDKVLSLNFPQNLYAQSESVIEQHARQYMDEGGDRKAFVMGCTEDFEAAHFEKVFSILLKVSKEYK